MWKDFCRKEGGWAKGGKSISVDGVTVKEVRKTTTESRGRDVTITTSITIEAPRPAFTIGKFDGLKAGSDGLEENDKCYPKELFDENVKSKALVHDYGIVLLTDDKYYDSEPATVLAQREKYQSRPDEYVKNALDKAPYPDYLPKWADDLKKRWNNDADFTTTEVESRPTPELHGQEHYATDSAKNQALSGFASPYLNGPSG